MPERMRRYMRPASADITPDTPIWCPWHTEFHAASAFNRERRRFSGLAGICRLAMAEQRQTPAGRNKARRRNQARWSDPEYRERALRAAAARRRIKGKEDLRRSRARLQRIVDDWKARGCVDCGYPDVRAIDPDHRDPTSKTGHVSRLVAECVAAQRMRDELDRCDPRCARCHRRRTAMQLPNALRLADRVPASWLRRLELQDFNDRLKLALGCADCGWAAWARGLDWDHARGIKEHAIAKLINDRWPVATLIAETAKCDVVCANCHRLRTASRRATVGRSSSTLH